MQGNLLSDPLASPPDEAASEGAPDYRQKVEHDLLQKIGTTLDPLLGREEIPRQRVRGLRSHQRRAKTKNRWIRSGRCFCNRKK